jgi:hypothetical protein
MKFIIRLSNRKLATILFKTKRSVSNMNGTPLAVIMMGYNHNHQDKFRSICDCFMTSAKTGS